MTAAYLFHIVQNHHFIDGNELTGTIAAIVFLSLGRIRGLEEKLVRQYFLAELFDVPLEELAPLPL